MIAAQSIQVGANDIVVAGGMESMSNTPKYVAGSRLVSTVKYTSHFVLFMILLMTYIHMY